MVSSYPDFDDDADVVVSSYVDVIPVKFPLQPLPSTSDPALSVAIDRFTTEYQHCPTFASRAPGRVNLIGEHIDYNGFGVLPMALQQSVFVACSMNATDSIEAGGEHDNLEDDTWELQIRSTSDDAKPCVHRYHHQQQTNRETPFDVSNRDWSHYVLAAFYGVVEALHAKGCHDLILSTDVTNKNNDGKGDSTTHRRRRISLLVHGRVPQGAGVSSSSALVVSSSLAFLALFGHLTTAAPEQQQQWPTLDKADIAALCARCERWVGTEGGGMDQAISLFAQAGQCQYIEFQPTLRDTPVPLPGGAVVVVCHSLEESHKREHATMYFNKRVVECKIGSFLLAQHLQLVETGGEKLPRQQTLLLWELTEKSQKTLLELEALVQSELETVYTKQQVMDLVVLVDTDRDPRPTWERLADRLNIVRQAGKEVLQAAESFYVRDRLLHVFSEARRVQEFVATCQQPPGASQEETLGRLLALSHMSCSKAYDCSSAQVDRLQQVCCRAPGTLGARMTGAGWGGCVLALVRADQVKAFCAHVRQQYYETIPASKQLSESEYMFATKPAQGSQVFQIIA